MSSLMTTTKFTEQEHELLMAGLDSLIDRYLITAPWLMSRIPVSFERHYMPKIRLIDSIREKPLLLDAAEKQPPS